MSAICGCWAIPVLIIGGWPDSLQPCVLYNMQTLTCCDIYGTMAKGGDTSLPPSQDKRPCLEHAGSSTDAAMPSFLLKQ